MGDEEKEWGLIERFQAKKKRLELLTCQHFRAPGRMQRGGKCGANIDIESVKGTLPLALACKHDEHWEQGGQPHCPEYIAQTEEQYEAREKRFAEATDLVFNQNLSACCKAPIDTSEVITSGRHKGHGKRTCSKCGALAYII